ncbi:hypothetical protein [Komagataeibacter kakiaceti]|uniref:hypothetical protein n=1 Tax=Komagataeibacter kakiaceti TaxID=943261 RepID=UPI001A7E8A01|nr:hypothetical protein [Komagataeibacter kakiaceti]
MNHGIRFRKILNIPLQQIADLIKTYAITKGKKMIQNTLAGERKFKLFIIFTLFICSIIISSFPLCEIFSHIPIAQNEGWNAYQIDRAMDPRLGPLYPNPDNGLIFNNYPPLSFYVVGVVSKYLIHDVIAAGRIVSFISILISCMACYFCTRSLGGSRFGAAISFFITYLYTAEFFQWWFITNDPQWLSISFILSGCSIVLLALDSQTKSMLPVIAASFLTVIGGLVKHNELAIPLCVTIWLFIQNRKMFYYWSMSGLAFLSLSLMLLYMVFGANVFIDVIHHPRTMSFRYASSLKDIFSDIIYIIIASLPCLIEIKNKKTRNFLCFFVLTCLVLGIFEKTGAGVSRNALIDTLIALSIAIGVGVSAFPQTWQGYRNPSMIWLVLVSLSQPIIKITTHTPSYIHDIRQIHKEEDYWNNIIYRVQSVPGLAACRMLSVCYWAHKPYTVDMFNLGQYVENGGKENIFDKMIRNREFDIIEYPTKNSAQINRERNALMKNLPEYYSSSFKVNIDDDFYKGNDEMEFFVPKK